MLEKKTLIKIQKKKFTKIDVVIIAFNIFRRRRFFRVFTKKCLSLSGIFLENLYESKILKSLTFGFRMKNINITMFIEYTNEINNNFFLIRKKKPYRKNENFSE